MHCYKMVCINFSILWGKETILSVLKVQALLNEQLCNKCPINFILYVKSKV